MLRSPVQAFGHEGYKEAGAVLEDRVRVEGRTRFADVVWKPRAVIEMKKRGERLAKHYPQLLNYWLYSTPNRPRYAILCNFEEFWIYDFETQMDEPMDRVRLDELAERYDALNFIFEEGRPPVFQNNRTAVTDEAAKKIGRIFRSLTEERKEPRDRAQRFTLQCVVAMFAEDTDLIPRGLFTELVRECFLERRSSYDLLGSLFHQMNAKEPARGGRFKGVPYFNGGIFSTVEPVELTKDELYVLAEACEEHWGRINPAIFGTLFQTSMGEKEQQQKGAVYTPETAIMRVVLPTIVEPWRERIAAADRLHELKRLRDELTRFNVLDPACGSGNFLYVAYRELKRLELQILEKIHANFALEARLEVGKAASIQIKQFHGIDTDLFAVELAKVTMVLAKKLALDEQHHALDAAQEHLGLDFDQPLPLENLDTNIRCADALFAPWPKVDAIIGNPPYESKNKLKPHLRALGIDADAYVDSLRARYKGVPGRADYCVYWFRRAHDELAPGARAGLVGTNTVRQNFSREGGLDYIVKNGGTITDAVSSMVWPGAAVVHVSVVNWTKADVPGKKRLLFQEGDHATDPWREAIVDRIPSSLREIDVTAAVTLHACKDSDLCLQGVTHGHKGFLLTRREARELSAKDVASRAVIHPYLTGDELVSGIKPDQWRYVIDLSNRKDLVSARAAGEAFHWVKERVMQDIVDKADEEREQTKKETGPRQSHAKRWWRLWRGRPELITRLGQITRYIGCSRNTRRPIFEFISSAIWPSDVVVAFPLDDDYSFGVLQSTSHWRWFEERCSSMKNDPRYTNESVFDTFPWPQQPTAKDVARVEQAAVALRRLRHKLLLEQKMNLRDLYESLEDPGEHPLKDAQAALDTAVAGSYGMGKRDDPVRFIFALNAKCAALEAAGLPITRPGLPAGVPAEVVTIGDCLTAPPL